MTEPSQSIEQQINAGITEIETLRNSKVICYVTSDKQPPFAAQIHQDIIPLFYKQLKKIGKVNKISLFLASHGGSLEAPWPLVNLIKEYCKNFEVIIPDKAFSAATLISLGADEIVMTSRSQLSPIDPAGNFHHNNQQISVQVEDVSGYIDFIKSKMGIVEQESLSEAMKELTKQVPPTILGSINRTHAQIRSLAEKLLSLHNKRFEYEQIKKIITNLTEKLYSHQHHINRNEAKNIVGLDKMVYYANDNEEDKINSLYEKIRTVMNLDFELFTLIPNDQSTASTLHMEKAYIKSIYGESLFKSEYIVKKITNPGGGAGINIDIIKEGWVTNLS